MLVTLKEILKFAEAKKCAIGSFNTPNLESALAVLHAAEKLNQPVILMHAEIHETMTPLHVIGPIMLRLAQKSSVPVCVHLDHGVTLSYLQQALNLGFTSIMYDGSSLPYDKNVANTTIAVEMASHTGASVEAEIGVIGRPELSASDSSSEGAGDSADENIYTDPGAAKRFAAETKIDALACAFGTAHGIYLKKPRLDFDRVRKIHALVDIPLVMHGGSGVSHEDYRKAIQAGIRKINYYTYMAKAGGEGVNTQLKSGKENVTFFHDIVAWGTEAMQKDVEAAIKVFMNEYYN